MTLSGPTSESQARRHASLRTAVSPIAKFLDEKAFQRRATRQSSRPTSADHRIDASEPKLYNSARTLRVGSNI